MCRSGRSSSEDASQSRQRQGELGARERKGAEDLVLGPDLAVAPGVGMGKDDNVVSMRAGRPMGDPLADYIDLWMALERFHERATLTEEGWSCLTEELQRPLELRLAERRPATTGGALKALKMARYLMDNLDGPDTGESGDWYRRLRNHLVESAHLALESGLLERPERRRERIDHAAG